VILGLLKDDVSTAFEEWYKELPVINGEECERKRSCPVLRYYFYILVGGVRTVSKYPVFGGRFEPDNCKIQII